MSKFVIKAADIAYQPKIDPNALKIEQINDHCLLYIASNLQLIDVIHLSRTSTRMRSVCQMHFRKFAHFSFGTGNGDPSINEENLPTILEVMGDYITSIEWVGLKAAEFELLARFCSNVTKIKLSSTSKDLNTAVLNRNKSFFGKVKRLCVDSSPLYDGGIKAMMSGRKVRTIDIQGCARIRGKFINSLNRNKLKNVLFVKCCMVQTPANLAIDKWKNKLVKFSYDSVGSLSWLASPPETLEQLKELHLDISILSDYSEHLQDLNFHALKNIQKITLSRRDHLSAINANHLISEFNQCTTLESLTIHGITIDHNTIGMLGQIQNLKCLHLVHVDNTIGKNFYKFLQLSKLRELSMSFATAEIIDGKVMWDMIVASPELSYLAHTSINFDLLYGILKAKKKFSGVRPVLKIGVPKFMMDDPRKVSLFSKLVEKSKSD